MPPGPGLRPSRIECAQVQVYARCAPAGWVGYARAMSEMPEPVESRDAGEEVAAQAEGSADGPDGGERSESFWEIVRGLGPASVLAVIASVLPAVGGIVLLLNIGSIGLWLQGQEALGVVVYVVAFMVLSGLALLPTYAQAILGGWAFGMAVGLPAALLGFFGGSLIGYAVASRFASKRAMVVLDEHPRWMAVRDALVGDGNGTSFWRTLGIVTLVRLPPNSPFALTNLLMASVRVPRLAFALGTLIGMAPRTAVVLFMATLIEGEISRDAMRAARPWWFVPMAVGLMFVMLMVIMWIAKGAMARVVGNGRNPPGEGGYNPATGACDQTSTTGDAPGDTTGSNPEQQAG